MEENKTFKICSDYKRVGLDFCEIQRDKNNPLDKEGYPIYPFVMPSTHGSSYTYKISDDWFFKRKLQDGNSPAAIFSQHHFNKNYNELAGSFDDLAEVICYILAKNIKDPETGEPIVKVAEYVLATFADKDGIMLRGCISKNVCTNENQTLINMGEILKGNNSGINSLNGYVNALAARYGLSNFRFDAKNTRRELLKNSYFCWKVANSDNHKNNITMICSKNPDKTIDVYVSPLIDNGSAYELSAPYQSSSNPEISRFETILFEDNFSKVDENGNRSFYFDVYPFMHNAFHIEPDNLLLDDTKINGKSFAYEYALASEMLSDEKLFKDIYEIERQFDIGKMIEEIDETYGANKNGTKSIDWPPYLKEYIYATNEVKSRTLSSVVADYYLNCAYSACVGKIDRENPSKSYEEIREIMTEISLLPSKEDYDKIFIELANSLNIKVDEHKLASLKFKKSIEFEKADKQPN